MFRYIAFVWSTDAPQQREVASDLIRRVESASPEWQTVAQSCGMRVLCAGTRSRSSDAFSLEHEGSVVLGSLFRNPQRALASAGAYERAALSAPEARRILRSEGRHLITDYWGRYVAFLSDSTQRKVWIVRSPTGGLPCFGMRYRGIHVFFSRLQDCLHFGFGHFSVNWGYIANRVASGLPALHETALNEIFEVHAGECLEVQQDQLRRSFYWDPLAVARSNPVEDVGIAAEELRSTARACAHAWASCYDRILHRLSGGLDSSIVLGCLQDAPSRPQITCINYFHPGSGQADERPFARLAAKRAQCDLVEQQRDPGVIDFRELREIAPPVNPAQHLAHLETNYWERRLAKERNATAIFGGEGGDALFCRRDKLLTVTDYVWQRGIGTDLFALASAVAPLVHLSFWKVLRTTIRDGMSRRGRRLETAYPGALITSETAASVLGSDRQLHPWFESCDDLPPGKLMHIRHVVFAEDDFYLPFGKPDDPEEVHPLRSQPFVELCLRIPTYLHMDGAKERGLARRAFLPDVPHEILCRFWKGGPGQLAKETLLRNMNTARELLLDGSLVRQGFLDRLKVEDALSGRPVKTAATITEIFDYLIVEAWLSSWTHLGQRAAA